MASHLTQTTSSPKRQYIITAIFALLAIMSALTIDKRKNITPSTTNNFQTMSIETGHSTSLEKLIQQEQGQLNKGLGKS